MKTTNKTMDMKTTNKNMDIKTNTTTTIAITTMDMQQVPTKYFFSTTTSLLKQVI